MLKEIEKEEELRERKPRLQISSMRQRHFQICQGAHRTLGFDTGATKYK